MWIWVWIRLNTSEWTWDYDYWHHWLFGKWKMAHWRRLTPPKIHSQNRCYKVNFTYSCFLCCFLCWHTPCHTLCGRGPDPLARATSHTAVLVTGGAWSVPPMAIIWATGSSYLLAFTTLWKGKSHLIQDIRVSMWCFDHIMRVSSDWNEIFPCKYSWRPPGCGTPGLASYSQSQQSRRLFQHSPVLLFEFVHHLLK